LDTINRDNNSPTVGTGAISQPEREAGDNPPLPQPVKWRRVTTAMAKVVPWIPALAVVIVIVLLMSRLVEFFTYSWSALLFPWQLNYDEGVNVSSSWLISQNVNIYRPHEPGRFISATHPPLFYLLNALAMKIWGLNLVSGRLISLIGTLGVGSVLWIWVYAETKLHVAGLLSTVIWFSLGPVYVWGTLYKQDMPALALGLAGGLLVLKSERRKTQDKGRDTNLPSVQPSSPFQNPKWIYWSILPLSLAFWMKQSSIVFFVAVGFYLLLRDRRIAFRWMLLTFGAIAIPFAAFDLFTNGGFHENLLTFRHYDYSARYFARNVIVLWTYHAILIMCGLAFAILALLHALKSKGVPQLSAIYILVAIPFTLAIFALPTANFGDPGDLPVAKYNQFLDILALLCLAFGASFGSVWQGLVNSSRNMRLDWALLMGGVLLLALTQVAMIYRQPATYWYPPLTTPLAQRAEYMKKVSDLLARTPGDILSEDNWLLLKNNRLVIYDDPAAMAVLAEAGAWDQSGLVQDLNRRRFSIIITEFDLTGLEHSSRWSREALRAFQSNYVPLFSEPNLGVVNVQR